jgi:hypothetical protein
MHPVIRGSVRWFVTDHRLWRWKFLQSFAMLDRLDYVAFGIIVLLGVMRLPEPLWGDQAIFLVGGKAIHDGALLYRDFWDLKPPGIYGLYSLTGTLFGFHEVGMHIMDLLWMLGLALGLRLTLRDRFSTRWVAKLLPWLAVGTYFAIIDPRQQMQVESLVGLPMYFTAWALMRAGQLPLRQGGDSWRYLLLAGLMGGIVLLLKLIYLPLLLAFWTLYLLHSLWHRGAKLWPSLRYSFGFLLLGVMLPITPVLLYWLGTGTLDDAFYTLFQHPPKMLKELPQIELVRLWKAFSWFLRNFAPLLILSGAAIVYAVRRLDLLMMQMVAWVSLGLLMVCAQSQSWWTYHFGLFLVPLAVLAAQGIDRLWQSKKAWRQAIVMGCLLYLVALNGLGLVQMVDSMVRSQFDFTVAGLDRYHRLVSPVYATATTETAFLRETQSRAGKVYFIADPVFYLVSDRLQAVPIIGWIPEELLQSQWVELGEQIKQARPPYVFVDANDQRYVPEDFVRSLLLDYRVMQRNGVGTWYEWVGNI